MWSVITKCAYLIPHLHICSDWLITKKSNIQSSVWATLMKLGMWVVMGTAGPSEVVWHGGSCRTKNLQGKREKEEKERKKDGKKKRERRKLKERERREGKERGENGKKGRGEQERKMYCWCKTPPSNCQNIIKVVRIRSVFYSRIIPWVYLTRHYVNSIQVVGKGAIVIV